MAHPRLIRWRSTNSRRSESVMRALSTIAAAMADDLERDPNYGLRVSIIVMS